jgi:hypothetical protein
METSEVSEVSEVTEALYGAVDLHCHSGPNPLLREFDHVEAVADAARLRMRAILMKSHHHNTVMDLLAMRPSLENYETKAFGGIALNAQVGGINPYAVAMSLRMGGKAVWFPTFSSRQHVAHGPKNPPTMVELPNRIVEIADADGELLDEVYEVLDLIAENDCLLSSGHLGLADARKVFEAGAGRGVGRMVVTHPNHVVGATQQDCVELARMGVYVEHEVGAYDPEGTIKWDPAGLLDWIRAVGASKTVLASDLGQKGRPMPVDGFLRVGGILLQLGLTAEELHQMACVNPAFLLGLDG